MSLRVRLVLTTAAVALIALAVAGVATYSAFSRAQLRQIDDSLQRAHEPIEQALSSDDDGDNVIERAASGTFVALRDPSGDTQLVVPLREPGRRTSHGRLDQLRGRVVADRARPGRRSGGVPHGRRHRKRRPVASADLVARRRQRAVRRPAPPRHRAVTPSAARDRARRHGLGVGGGRRRWLGARGRRVAAAAPRRGHRAGGRRRPSRCARPRGRRPHRGRPARRGVEHDARPDPRVVRRTRRHGGRAARLATADAALRRRCLPRAAHAAGRGDAPTPSCSNAVPAPGPTTSIERSTASPSRAAG